MANSTPSPLGLIDDPYGASVSLRQCLEAVLGQAPALIEKTLDSLSGKGDKFALGLLMIKPNFPPNVQAVVNLLLANKQQVIDVFVERLRYYVYLGVGTSGQSQQLMRFEDLRLFEEEDLDESLEVASAMQEMLLQTRDIQPELDALLSTLLGWITVQPHINPLRPEMFTRALRDSIVDQVDNASIRGAIVLHLVARLGVVLSRLYVELCKWLRSYGVEEASLGQPANALLAGQSQPNNVSNTVARTMLTLDKLRRLLAGELDGHTDGSADFLHTVPASVETLQDMRQVEAMVKRLEKKAKLAKDNPKLKAQQAAAKARIALKDGRELGKALGEEVIRLMLDNLIQDERLLPRVRGVLHSLEPTLMKIAQEDGRFFSDKQHVARQFLDAITNRSLGFAHENEEGYDDFVGSIEQSVALLQQVPVEGAKEAVSFVQVMEHLSKLWEQLDQEEQLRREEAAKALMHAEQRNTMAQFIAEGFRQQAQGLKIPQVVIDFVCGPWAHAVAESQLRSTDGRTDPLGYQGLVAELFWSVQTRRAKKNLRRLMQLIPGMLAKLRQGLVMIEFPPERITDFFANLIQLHEVALESGRQLAAERAAEKAAKLRLENPAQDQESATMSVQEGTMSQFEEAQAQVGRVELESLYAASDKMPLEALPAMPEPISESDKESESMFEDFPSSRLGQQDAGDGIWLANSEATDTGFVKNVAMREYEFSTPSASSQPHKTPVEASHNIPLGSWVEIKMEGIWVRAQLTWISPMRTLFMFVSRGATAHSMSKRTMDKLSTQGMIRLISDGHLVDNALDAVAQTALRNSVGSQRAPE